VSDQVCQVNYREFREAVKGKICTFVELLFASPLLLRGRGLHGLPWPLYLT